MIDEAQFERLRKARDRLLRLIDDERTPSYSVAPAVNQLRLVERAMYPTHQEPDEGLPDPTELGLIDLLGYRRHLNGPYPPSRLRVSSEWADKQAEVFEAWRRGGFELTPLEGDTKAWVEENTERLRACLEGGDAD